MVTQALLYLPSNYRGLPASYLSILQGSDTRLNARSAQAATTAGISSCELRWVRTCLGRRRTLTSTVCHRAQHPRGDARRRMLCRGSLTATQATPCSVINIHLKAALSRRRCGCGLAICRFSVSRQTRMSREEAHTGIHGQSPLTVADH